MTLDPHASAAARGLSRRDFVRASACGAAALASGCATAPLRGADSRDYIDAHAHVFNGRDVTLATYAQNAIEHAMAGRAVPSPGDDAGRRAFAAWKHRLVRALARSAGELVRAGAGNTAGELQYLRRYMRETPVAAQSLDGFVRRCGRGACEEHFTARYADLQRNPVAYLPAAVQEEMRRTGAAATDGDRGDAAARNADILRLALFQMTDFIRRLCAFRAFNAWELGDRYPEVGCFCALMVNFDAWMPAWDAATTSRADQIEIMQRIAWLSRGRILPVMSYDPLLHAGAGQDGRLDPGRGATYFAQVRDAIERRGFVGIKLYPPMGFRPFDNAARDGGGAEPFPPCVVARCGGAAGLGAALDRALGACYAWCADPRTPGGPVPVVAHCNRSNGNVLETGDDLAECAHPRHWQAAVKAHDLHLALGHFGGLYEAGSDAAGRDWMRFIRDWLGGEAAGRHVFADVSHFTEVARERMEEVFRTTVAGDPAQADRMRGRLLYGTDWFMPMAARTERLYFRRWKGVLDRAFGDHRAAMCDNARQWNPRIAPAREFFADSRNRPASFA